MGRRVRKPTKVASAADVYPSAHDPGDLRNSLQHVSLYQMGAADSCYRCHDPDWWIAGTACYGNSFQRLIGSWVPRALWCFGTDRGNHARVHQSTACAWLHG